MHRAQAKCTYITYAVRTCTRRAAACRVRLIDIATSAELILSKFDAQGSKPKLINEADKRRSTPLHVDGARSDHLIPQQSALSMPPYRAWLGDTLARLIASRLRALGARKLSDATQRSRPTSPSSKYYLHVYMHNRTIQQRSTRAVATVMKLHRSNIVGRVRILISCS